MRALDSIALILLIVGGLNWGLVGAFQFDLVATLFGEGSGLSRLVYVLVGLSAIVVAARARNLLSTGATARI
ncbi:MAG: DUF378 domain-containing protein [Gemmatimonadota bacterium]